MAIEAPFSKFRRTNLKIYIVFCLGVALWFGYDGYFNESFKAKHTGEDGKPNSNLVFNQKAPPFFLAGAVVFAVYMLAAGKKKLVADEDALITSSGEKIPYDSIEQIDKTDFDKKGSFVITYKNAAGKGVNCRLSSRQFDNLAAVLEHLVGKIS